MIILIAVLTGFVMGIFYYGGLWMTIRAVIKSQRTWLLIASFWGRTALALAAFLLVIRGDWRNALACMVGFILARGAVTLYLRSKGEDLRAPHA